jgi:ribonucleoside-diphosphate reductase alpha chain
MISAVFRRGGDVTFVVDELKAIFDPQGGHWMDGRYVPSLLAAIGDVIEKHMIQIGFLKREEIEAEQLALPQINAEGATVPGTIQSEARVPGKQARAPRRCPRCQAAAFLFQSGCWTCRECGYSKCG